MPIMTDLKSKLSRKQKLKISKILSQFVVLVPNRYNLGVLALIHPSDKRTHGYYVIEDIYTLGLFSRAGTDSFFFPMILPSAKRPPPMRHPRRDSTVDQADDLSKNYLAESSAYLPLIGANSR